MVTFRQTLRPSLRFAALLVAAHLLAVILLYLAALPAAAKLALTLPVVASLVYYLARDVFCLLPDSWKTLVLVRESVTVIARNGADFSGQVVGDSFVSPYFIVLRVKVEGRRMPLARVIFPDALAVDAFRELCVFLRFA